MSEHRFFLNTATTISRHPIKAENDMKTDASFRSLLLL